MTTPRATRITLRTDVVGNVSSLALVDLSDWVSCQWREAVAGDFGSCSLVLPADSPNVASAAIGNVIRIAEVYPGNTNGAGQTLNIIREYRIQALHDGAHLNTVEVTGVPILYDLGKALVAQTVGGVPMLNFSVVAQTPSAIYDTFIAPVLTAYGYTWFSKGTFNGDALTLSWERLTVLGLLRLLATNTGLELAITRNIVFESYDISLTAHSPTTDDTMPVAWVGRNVLALDRQINADQRFFTECVPVGATPDGEVETPGIEQAVFKVSAVSGDTLTITNPVSSYGPIGFDDQLDGLTVLTTLDAIPLHNIDTNLSAGTMTTGVAYDTVRKTVHVPTAKPSAGGQIIAWHKLDDGTSGQYAVGTDMRGIAYAPSSDRLYVGNRGSQRVDVVNPATNTVVTNIAVSSTGVNKVRYIAGWDRIVVQHANGFDVINPNTNANLGTIGSAQLRDFVLYNASANKVAVFSPGLITPTATGAAYNPTTLALLTTFGGPASTSLVTPASDGSGTICAIGDVSGAKVGFTWDWATFTPSATTTIATLGAVALAPMASTETWYSSTSGKFYTIGATALYEWTTSFVRTANVSLNFEDTVSAGWWLESTLDYLFIPDGTARHVKLLQVPQLGAWQKATVSSSAGSSRASNQQFDRVAGSRGLTFTGQRVEFRQNAALDYRKVLTDPAAIATYGAIDGVLPQEDWVGRRNYLRGGSSDEWRSDNVEKYLATIDESNNGQEFRWQSADESPRVGAQGTIASNYTAGNGTISLSGLGTLTLSPGDVISLSPTSPFAANNFGVVAKRVVAAGGAAVVTLWGSGINSSLGAGNLVYIYKPSITSLGKLSTADIPVLYGSARTLALCAAYGMASVPSLVGMSTAWAIARLVVVSYNGAPNTIALAAYGDGSGFMTHEVSISDATAYNDGIAREYVLAQRVDLTPSSTHVALRLRSSVTAPGVVVYVKSLMVIHGAAAITDHDIPYSGSSMLWALGNRALQDAISPQITYQVQAVEDDPDTALGFGLLALGREIRLRDPVRGIAATPRLIEITRTAVNRQQQFRQPVLTLATRPTSLVDSVVNLES